MPRFLECFSTRSVDAPSSGISQLPSCIFCDVSKESGFDVVHEDERFIAFRDRAPQAETHILIIPRDHIGSVRDLRNEHLPILRQMVSLAHRLSPSTPKLGFHIPPFSSVPHLHLHVLAGKPTTLGRFKYPVRLRERGGKGWSWFVTPEQVEEILQKGGIVSLGRG